MSKGINWITEEEAVKLLGLTKYTLRTYTRGSEDRKKLKDIRTSKISKTKILYSKVDIEKFIESKIA